MIKEPWRIPGPCRGPESPGLHDALKRLHEGRLVPPTSADAPPPSVFPMTRAARAALAYSR